MKKLAEEAKTEINKAYQEDVTAAKKAATEALVALDAGFAGNSNFAATDRAAIVAETKTAIEKVTTVQEVADIVNAATNSDGKTIGKYNVLYERKTSAFAAIDSALANVEEIFDGEHETELAELKAKLKVYGVEVSSLPSEVAATWYTKISAAKDLPVYTTDPADDSTDTYSKGDVVMGYEGAKAVKESYQGVKDKLLVAIKGSYNKEIEASKVLGTDGMVVMEGVVNTTINSWVATNDSDGSYSIINYLSSDAPSSYSVYDGGLIRQIEALVAQQITIQPSYQGFDTERKVTASAAAKAELDSYLDAVLKDSVYASLLKTSTKISRVATDIVLAKVGTTDKTMVASPLYGTLGTTAVTGKTGYVELGDVAETTIGTSFAGAVTGLGGVTGADIASYSGTSVKTYYDMIYKTDTDGKLTSDAPWKKFTSGTVAQIKAGVSVLESKFNGIHEGAVDLYEKAQKATIATTAGTGVNIVIPTTTLDSDIDVTMVQGYFDSLLPQKTGVTPYDKEANIFANITKAITTIYDQKANINEINTNLATWLADVEDAGFEFTAAGTGKEVFALVLDAKNSESIISKTLAAEYVNTEAVDKAMKSMDELYAKGVAKYLEDAKKSFLAGYNLFVAGRTPSEVATAKVAYDGLLALASGTYYDCKSYASVENWLNHSLFTLTSEVLGGFEAETFVPAVAATYNEGGATVTPKTITAAEKLIYTSVSDVTAASLTKGATGAGKAYTDLGFKETDKAANGNFYYWSINLGSNMGNADETAYDGTKAYIKVNGKLRYAPVADAANNVNANSEAAYDGSWVIAVKEAGKKTYEIEMSPDGIHSYFFKFNVDITALGA